MSQVQQKIGTPGSEFAPPRNVPFFDYRHLYQQHMEEILLAVQSVMERGAYILQTDLRQFEQSLAGFLGVQHALGVANGTDSLHMILRAIGVGRGDEVVLPSHTYVATAAAVHFSGAQPVLVECGTDHLIDPEAARAAITPRTRVIIPVHLNGRTCEMESLTAMAHRAGLYVVEDAAQAIGSKFRGRHAGTFGIAGSFSFYPAKVLGCFGDGGSVVTQDPKVARTLALLRDHGRDERGEVVTWGLNSRLDNLQAAVLNVKLGYLEQEIVRRREVAARYEENLNEIEDLVLPPGPNDDPDHFDVYQNYEVESGRRDELRAYLEERGVRTIVQWGGKAVHQFEGLGFDAMHLPRTDGLFKRCFLLPMNTSLSDDVVHYVCRVIREFYGLE